MKIDKLGDISPMAGMMTGEGVMGELMRKGAGVIPQAIAKDAYSDEEEKRRKQAAGAAPTGATMKKGGKVSSASKRADGIATKGKTRGTMITMKGGGYAC
jgi:hypothetical protein